MPVCVMCHEDKPASEFALRSRATGQLQSHCRKCHAAYRRQHYLDHRDVYIAREMARIDGYRAENRRLIFEYLGTHPCVDCGETDALVLEFDHRDRKTKRSEVARLAASKPWKVVRAEIDKCDVRCGNCHRKRTATQLGWGSASSITTLGKASEQSPVIQLQVSDLERRTCNVCGHTKSILEFSVKNKNTGCRAHICHSCVAANSRKHYRANKARYLERNRKNKKRYRTRHRSRKAEFVAGLACIDCGEANPVVLEFDHRDASIKVANVSRLMAARAWQRVEAEIAKCDVRCVNCHRRRTAAQFGWTKVALSASA